MIPRALRALFLLLSDLSSAFLSRLLCHDFFYFGMDGPLTSLLGSIYENAS
jgi:hypothetical protein